MPSTYWLKIREWNGSQPDAFEELSSQLAHDEAVPTGSVFTRKGRPDSGLECFWKLPNGDEWGWQAKFFPDGLTENRLAQCDKSVTRALGGHPRLKRLFFCFPTLFPDERKGGKVSALGRWVKRKAKWEAQAVKLGRTLEIVLWDEHELVARLTKPEHKGREWFWFNTPAMDSEWFRKNLEAAVALARERYSPQLHFETSVAEAFEALGRTPHYLEGLQSITRRVADAHASIRKIEIEAEPETAIELAGIKKRIEACLDVFRGFSDHPSAVLEFRDLNQKCKEARASIEDSRNILFNACRTSGQLGKHETERLQSHPFDDQDRALRGIQVDLASVQSVCESINARLANVPRLLLIGDAGFGKTHLFCHVAKRRISANHPTLLLLGERFNDSEPWGQIIDFLGLHGVNRDQFLGALDSASEASGVRGLIMIDAINEGEGISFWKKHVPSMLVDLERFRHLGIAISIRKVYVDSRTLPVSKFVSVSQPGFAGTSIEASRQFFQRYGLAEPNVPLLLPEFDNPLFLKLLCEATKASGKETIPSELSGATAIFSFLLSSVNYRLAELLDYDEVEDLVLRAVHRLGQLMAENESEYLPLSVARAELEVIYPSKGFSKSLLQSLIGEHVLVRMPSTKEPTGKHEVIRFTYQRLSDHLIVEAVLKRATPKTAVALFRAGGVFGRHISKFGIWRQAGWFEALAIQLPERFGIELDEMINLGFKDETVRKAFIESLKWRDSNTVTRSCVKRVRAMVETEHAADVLDAIISLCARPVHPLNADWLDKLLRPHTMASRDAFWSIFLFGSLNDQTSVRRLVDWAWAEREDSRFSSEVARLAGVTLTWFLTASDRFLRDRATKALVSLLENRLDVLRWLRNRFSDVAEPYIQERLLAVAYGCSMLTEDFSELKCLAQETYDKVFRNGSPPPSVLLRDHARGIIERALFCGLALDLDKTRIIPPFKSEWPKSPPSLTVLRKRYRVDRSEEKYRGFSRVYVSVTGDDFRHYVVDDVLRWSDRKLASEEPACRVFHRIRSSVSEEMQTMLDSYVEHCDEASANDPSSSGEAQQHRALRKKYEEYFAMALGRDAELFDKCVLPWLKRPKEKRHRHVFKLELFQRLLLQRVLEYGFNVDCFSYFDAHVPEKGRRANKSERIGKKYQWIAYDELHARISDNFGPAENAHEFVDPVEWRLGVWPTDYRDIDPSFLLRESTRQGTGANYKNWWTPKHFDRWHFRNTPQDWLRDANDLPEPKEFLFLKDGLGKSWLLLDGYARWEQEKMSNSIAAAGPLALAGTQEVHYIFRSYVTRKEHFAAVIGWAKEQDWINHRLPLESRYDAYFHEHFWGPQFYWPADEEWVHQVYSPSDLPYPVVATSARYIANQGGYDCSVDIETNVHIPSRWLANQMAIKPKGRFGEFVDKTGQIIAFDPSLREKGYGALVVDPAKLSDFFERNGFRIFWTFLGEKNIYPPNMDNWLGRQTMLGVYALEKGQIVGSFRSEFTPGRK